jgi:hypothetical protein
MMQLDIFADPLVNHTANCDLKPLIFDFGLEKPYQPPVPLSPVVEEPPHRIKFAPGTATHDSLLNEWKALPPDIRRGRLVLKFSEPVILWYNRRKSKTQKEHVFRLFTDKNTGGLCYTQSTRTGFFLKHDYISRLISIEPEAKKDLLSMVKKLANRIHPNAWDDLKEKLLANPQHYLSDYGYTVTNISGKFPDYVIENIRNAFKEKLNFSYGDYGGYRERKTGRDLKVECKLCEDGIYRAWFYSEFPGCANGDYWLLLNPTTAAFKERD